MIAVTTYRPVPSCTPTSLVSRSRIAAQAPPCLEKPKRLRRSLTTKRTLAALLLALEWHLGGSECQFHRRPVKDDNVHHTHQMAFKRKKKLMRCDVYSLNEIMYLCVYNASTFSLSAPFPSAHECVYCVECGCYISGGRDILSG